MRSSYKKIGPYIRQIDLRNIDDKKDNLLGVSTQKVFIDSIANTIGTDFKTYKIVKRRQFTYVADTSRRGDKIGIALLDTYDEGLVSPIYTVFEIIDHDVLLPEYLMMWFRRPEFDRYARFKSHGSVRELFSWEEMCEVELPIPLVDKQRQIVEEYNTIVSRIKLKERFNKNLEETAQAIYKRWFIDFEFPISAKYAAAMGKPELEGYPYKSSGGEMVYNDVLAQEIPKGWETKALIDIAYQQKKIISVKNKFGLKAYIGLEHMPKMSIALNKWESVDKIESNKFMFNKGDILFGKLRPYFHKVGVALVDGLCSTDIVVIKPKSYDLFGFLTMLLSSNAFVDYANSGWSGTKMPRTSWEFMSKYVFPRPDDTTTLRYNNMLITITKEIEYECYLSNLLIDFSDVISKKIATIKAL